MWNPPTSKFIKNSNAETIFNRLDDHGKTWKIYVSEPMAFSWHGMIHYERLKDQSATHFVPFSQFETDAANGDLPDFSFIEPNMIIGHNDYHPAFGRSFECQRGLARRGPAGVDPRWRGVPLPDLRRLPGDAGRRRAPTCGTRRC